MFCKENSAAEVVAGFFTAENFLGAPEFRMRLVQCWPESFDGQILFNAYEKNQMVDLLKLIDGIDTIEKFALRLKLEEAIKNVPTASVLLRFQYFS